MELLSIELVVGSMDDVVVTCKIPRRPIVALFIVVAAAVVVLLLLSFLGTVMSYVEARVTKD